MNISAPGFKNKCCVSLKQDLTIGTANMLGMKYIPVTINDQYIPVNCKEYTQSHPLGPDRNRNNP